jgi:hypothetical protein
MNSRQLALCERFVITGENREHKCSPRKHEVHETSGGYPICVLSQDYHKNLPFGQAKEFLSVVPAGQKYPVGHGDGLTTGPNAGLQ